MTEIEMQLDWIKKINPYYYENLQEDEEIMWNTLWNWNHLEYTEEDAKTVRECGMIPIEADGLLFCALRGCGMDLTAEVIYTRYKLTSDIDLEGVKYLARTSREYIEYVIGKKKTSILMTYAKTLAKANFYIEFK
jgi:hypothetical protein